MVHTAASMLTTRTQPHDALALVRGLLQVAAANLAVTLKHQAHYQQAAEMQLKILTVWTRVAGPLHVGSLSAKGNLASA
jgi:hypothetical protein